MPAGRSAGLPMHKAVMGRRAYFLCGEASHADLLIQPSVPRRWLGSSSLVNVAA
jgi:hypothetical protein